MADGPVSKVSITLPDGAVRTYETPVTGMDVAADISVAAEATRRAASAIVSVIASVVFGLITRMRVLRDRLASIMLSRTAQHGGTEQ